jgi:two-component system chemotaxis response regulator CheY
MIDLDDELAGEYLAECREHLAVMEAGLLAIEKHGAEIDEEAVNQVFRAAHSVKGGAGFFDLLKVGELAHHTEDVLALMRSRKLEPTPHGVGVLLRATDRLRDLIRSPATSNQADISETVAALAGLHAEPAGADGDTGASAGPRSGWRLRALLAEDDLASRLLLQTFLSRYGDCHIAINGREAVEAVRASLARGQGYDLICMDIMMPEMDGREAVRQVRALEMARGILSTYGAKIIMTTAVDDVREVIRCFQELCDSYLIKPIDLNELLRQMKAYRVVQ